MWLVVTEVHSEKFGLVTERHHDIGVLCAMTAVSHIFPYWTLLTVMHVLFSLSSVVSHDFSVLCMYSMYRHHRHHLDYLLPNFVSVATSVAEVAHGEKLRTLSINHSHSHSDTHSPSLSDAPGTKAFASENIYQQQQAILSYCKWNGLEQSNNININTLRRTHTLEITNEMYKE